MVLYLTDNTSAQDIIEAKESGLVYAANLYPAGATTNSSSGVTDIAKLTDVFAAMQTVGMPLLIHGEVTRLKLIFSIENKCLLTPYYQPLVANYPNLKSCVRAYHH